MPPVPCSFDRVAHCYDATRAIPADAHRAVTAAILDVLPPAPRVLEVGIGTGRIAMPLLEAGVAVTGVDVAPRMLARLRARRPGVPLTRALGAALPFRAGAFDAVLFVHVLHLVGDVDPALREAVRVLRAGGRVVRGRTEYSESPRTEVYRVVDRAYAAVTGERLARATQGGRADLFADAARRLGARHDERAAVRWPERTTGREMLRALETARLPA